MIFFGGSPTKSGPPLFKTHRTALEIYFIFKIIKSSLDARIADQQHRTYLKFPVVTQVDASSKIFEWEIH